MLQKATGEGQKETRARFLLVGRSADCAKCNTYQHTKGT